MHILETRWILWHKITRLPFMVPFIFWNSLQITWTDWNRGSPSNKCFCCNFGWLTVLQLDFFTGLYSTVYGCSRSINLGISWSGFSIKSWSLHGSMGTKLTGRILCCSRITFDRRVVAMTPKMTLRTNMNRMLFSVILVEVRDIIKPHIACGHLCSPEKMCQ